MRGMWTYGFCFRRNFLQYWWHKIENFNNQRELTLLCVSNYACVWVCVRALALFSIKRMDSCYRLYLVFIPNILYLCRFPFPYDIQRQVGLNRREAKAAAKAAKDSKESVAQQLVCEETQKNHAAYTHVVLLRSILEVDEKKLMGLMVPKVMKIFVCFVVLEGLWVAFVSPRLLWFRSFRLTKHTLRDKSSKESLGRPGSFFAYVYC